MWQDFKELLASYGLTGLLGMIVLWHMYVAATKPENFKIIYGWIWYVLSFPFKKFQKKAIRFRIEGPCTKALKIISNELPEIDIPDLKISWVNEDNLKTKLTSGKAIVKLRFDKDNTRNIIKATTIYVKDAFLIHAKNHLTLSFRKALDLSITKNILFNISTKENNRSLITQFIDENLDQEPEVFEKCEKIAEIDDNGLFTRILLRELNNFGNELFGRVINTKYSKEADDFLQFIYNIVSREYDDYTPLVFSNNIIKAGIVLVAKPDTYYQYGVDPYLRRIKLGLTRGIKTFYMLARSEKVDILKKISTDILNTGNFIQINKSRKYKDRQGRTVRCYCLQVNDDSILANSLNEIGEAIKNKTCISAIVTKVMENIIQVDFNGIEGYITQQNLSIVEINDARLYFKEDSLVEALPIEIMSDGTIEFTFKKTNSDPNHLLTTKFTIGNNISGTISYIDDHFIKLDIGQVKVEGIAFRESLTPSRFINLSEKFSVGQELQLQIKGYNYERANIILELIEKIDTWPPKEIRKHKKTNVRIYKKTHRSLVGELSEGIEAVIPFWELNYFDNQIENAKNKIKIGDNLECVVTEINNDDQIVFLSYRKLLPNPYQEFFKYNENKIFDFIVDEINSYGILGHLDKAESPFDVYIPKYEMSWNRRTRTYNIGTKKQVAIKAIDNKGDRFIGSFKPILRHPLTNFKHFFNEGQVLKNLKLLKTNDYGIIYEVNLGKETYEAILFKGEISNLCYIDSSTELGRITSVTMQIKKIDLEKNRILLSLRDINKLNNNRFDEIDYIAMHNGIVLGQKHNDYVVLIEGLWIEGFLETVKQYNVGQNIKVRAASVTEEKLVLTDE